MDIARLERALAARSVARKTEHLDNYMTDPSRFNALDPDERKELMWLMQEKRNAKRSS